MPEHTGDKAIVHIVDDDDSLRRAVDSLCRSVGLQSRAYGSAQVAATQKIARNLAARGHHRLSGRRLSGPGDMGTARLSQPDLLP